MQHRGRGIWRNGKEQLRNLEDEPISRNDVNKGSSGEIFLGDLFEAWVARMARAEPRRCVPKFFAFYREVPATVGVADFIGVIGPRWRFTEQRLERKLHGLPRGPVAEVLSRLSYRRETSRKDLLKVSNYTRPVVSMAIQNLLNAKVIRNRGEQGYLLDSGFKYPQADVYFYEIKMENWRRALFQATQAQVYADKAYCVMPHNKRQVITGNRQLFRNVGVGVILFDQDYGKVVELIAGRKKKPKRAADKLDVLIRLATAENLLS